MIVDAQIVTITVDDTQSDTHNDEKLEDGVSKFKHTISNYSGWCKHEQHQIINLEAWQLVQNMPILQNAMWQMPI